MYKTSAMGDAAGPSYSEGDNAKTIARTMDNADGLERAEDKIDITTPDKTNKTPILVSY